MSSNNNENDDLKEIWSLFQDSPEEIQQKRQQITKAINSNNKSFPSQISIVTAFDELLLCFALGGQVKNYYRYGSYSTCAEQREKVWFALKNGTFSSNLTEEIDYDTSPKELEKRQNVQAFFKRRLLEEKAKGSSEDIWDAREKPLNQPFKEYK
ncbi:uncharacterized protein AC631_05513 [Debaryomyces fabryi]|uniref:Early meiotic induction protein 1 n=1 Tax=Debaryomyces fabryi TaxID=58627 RepID=A0A0V1PR63_9ASCO|nr:uncharacterized protein AC631_05513 [Debaryomyces fabryi]KRZ98725.1 hypothetical protein AC631_05513 [Debaryomyces fabryi]CUM52507.1 unnamed protein product [Debaryomyces fabryi]